MQKEKRKNVGIFIFDLVEVLDFSGPYEVFSSARLTKKSTSFIQNTPKAFNVFTFSEKKKYISASGGLKVKSDFIFKNCPVLDILIIPGGIGTRKLLKNKKILNWLKLKKKIDIIASVCTGSLLLAKAGLLEKKRATTHWGALKLLKKISPSTIVISKNKYVYDKYYTSAGVATGIDMSLHIIENVHGKTIAKNTAKYIEYKY
jgi:transcriptional regulator GlxA family with amidase domain